MADLDSGIVRGARRRVVAAGGATRASSTAPTTTTEWGVPTADDVRLFETLSLEGFQAGLSWLTILRKREGFREAFAGFDIHDGRALRRAATSRGCSATAAIVRHRGKIEAVINNAVARARADRLGGLAGGTTSGASSLPRSRQARPCDARRAPAGAGGEGARAAT